MQHVLEEAERTDPSAEQLAEENTQQQDRPERDEREEMVARIMDENSDGAGEPG